MNSMSKKILFISVWQNAALSAFTLTSTKSDREGQTKFNIHRLPNTRSNIFHFSVQKAVLRNVTLTATNSNSLHEWFLK